MVLRDDARVDLPADFTDRLCGAEGPRRHMYWCYVPMMEGVWAPVVHSPCWHNELAGLVRRTLGPSPEFPDSGLLALEFKKLRTLCRRLGVQRMTMADVVAGYRGPMRLKYQRALESFSVDSWLVKRDRRLDAFVKGEKVNPLAKSPTKPRVIMARSPRFNLRLATYLKPFEFALWKRWKGDPAVSHTRLVAKGLNLVERARLIRRKMGDIGEGCVVFEVDGSQFEAHVTADDLRLEHSTYRAAYPRDQELDFLLSSQLVVKGRTMCGIKYSRDGCRASGDYNTGMGNSIIMTCACLATMKLLIQRHGPIRYTLLADGDNCLLFVEPVLAGLVHQQFAASCREVSPQELVVEESVTLPEKVVFGQSQGVWNGRDWIMCRSVWKVLSGAFCSYKHYGEYRFGLRLLKAVIQCELYLALGLPVLQAYFAEALRQVAWVRDLRDPTLWLDQHALEAIKLAGGFDAIQRAGLRPVTLKARESFEAAFGIGIQEQLRYESVLPRDLNLPVDPDLVWKRVKVWDVEGPEVVPAVDTNYLDRSW